MSRIWATGAAGFIVSRYGPPVPGDARSTWAGLGRAARKPGYEPRVSLDEGVETQVSYALARRRTPSIV